VIKIRLQIQGEGTLQTEKKYKGFIQGIYRILVEEGFAGIYKGLTPSLMREGSYSTIRMGGYDLIKGFFPYEQNATPLWLKFASGLTSGAVGAAIANPTDLIKVRMQAEAQLLPGQSPRYANTLQAFRHIYRTEGIKGLYRGVNPTTQRAALLTASQLSSYDHVKYFLLRNTPLTEGGLLHFSCSIVAGLVSAITTSPVDLIKTRIMNMKGKAEGKATIIYKNSWDCLIKTIQHEGVFGLYKGFFPNWIRIAPHTTVTFLVYEKFRKWTGMRPV